MSDINFEPGIRTCSKCGRIIPKSADKCSFCGTPVITWWQLTQQAEDKIPDPSHNTISQYPIGENNSPIPPKRNNKTLLLLSILIGLVLILGGVLTWYLLSDNNHNTSQADIDIQEEQYDLTPESSADVITSEAEPTAAPVPAPAAPDRTYYGLGGSWTLQGTVKGKYPIGMKIKVADDGSVSGKYWYDITIRKYGDKPQNYFRIDGFLDTDGSGQLYCYEYGKPDVFETWDIDFSSDGYMNGSLTNMNTGTVMSISLYQ